MANVLLLSTGLFWAAALWWGSTATHPGTIHTPAASVGEPVSSKNPAAQVPSNEKASL